MKLTHEFIEKNVGWLIVMTIAVVAVGGLVEIVPLFFQKSTTSPVAGVTPYPPLLGMWHAVTRHVDALGGSLGADEAVSVEQALAMYTRGSAWLSFSEQERGMIRPGLLADWVALSEDPLAIEPMALRDIRIDATAIGGELVYEAETGR